VSTKETYREYLKSEHWQQTRTKKRRRNKQCGICGATSRLDVHHLTYRQLFNVEQSDLRVLCRTCHDLAHALKDRGVYTFRSTNHLHRWEVVKAAIKANFRLGHPRPRWSGKVTQPWLMYYATPSGAWTAQQMIHLGVTWPPPKGWLHGMIGEAIPEAHALGFQAISDALWAAR
jgi:hypothetical protein